jgi:vacuolar-type H+-ATPase subunit I/STV1
MSDGTTATISPIVEDSEMSHVRSVFDRAANAIVQASELAKQVASLTEQMDLLRKDIEYVRQRNIELDNLLNDVRQARDHAQSEASRLTQTNADLSRENTSLTYERDNLTDKLKTANDTISTLRRERDDAAIEAMRLQEELDKVKAKLDDIVSFAKGLVAEATPTPPTPAPEPTPTPPEPQPYQEPQPTPAVWPNTTF